jgi:hypothetical protein
MPVLRMTLPLVALSFRTTDQRGEQPPNQEVITSLSGTIGGCGRALPICSCYCWCRVGLRTAVPVASGTASE